MWLDVGGNGSFKTIGVTDIILEIDIVLGKARLDGVAIDTQRQGYAAAIASMALEDQPHQGLLDDIQDIQPGFARHPVVERIIAIDVRLDRVADDIHRNFLGGVPNIPDLVH